MDQLLLQVNSVSRKYPQSSKPALDQVSFHIRQGECLGLVGESGSGKSTMARLVLGLEKPDSGEIGLKGMPWSGLKGKEQRAARRHIQAVFQDPASSFNPRIRLWKSVVEPLEHYPHVRPSFLGDARNHLRASAELLLDKVGLSSDMLDCYPHQLSGGQRQRAAIARGLALQPDLLVCDEPTSSLDVSVQAQILNLLKQLKVEFGMSFLFISHDLAAVRFLCDRLVVLKEGQLIDECAAGELHAPERHPYTRSMVELAG